MGLVNAVHPDGAAMLEAAKKLAREIAANAPLAVQATKEVLNASRHLPVTDGMSLAKHKNMVLMLSQDLKEAFVSFMEKRQPDFKGK
jgi:enoyl-CoA hydratase